MNDVPGMNEGHSLADLAREADARFLRQHEVGTDRSLEQLPAVHTALHNTTLLVCRPLLLFPSVDFFTPVFQLFIQHKQL